MPDYNPEILSYHPDDNVRIGWAATSNKNEWIIIKFPEEVEVAGIKARIVPDSGGFKKFSFQYYTPQKENYSLWTDVYTGVGPDEDYWVEYTFPLTKSDRFRMYIYDAYGGTDRIAIMELKLGFIEGMVHSFISRIVPKKQTNLQPLENRHC